MLITANQSKNNVRCVWIGLSEVLCFDATHYGILLFVSVKKACWDMTALAFQILVSIFTFIQ